MATVRSNPERSVRILHVAESWGAGVATAVLAYIRHAPHCEHHLLHGQRAESAALPAGWRSEFASARPMPEGHARRIGSVGALARDIDADIVHAHSSFAGAYTRLGLLNSTRRRIIYTPHAYSFEREDLPVAGRRALRGLEWMLAANTDTIAACSLREQDLSRFRFSGVHTTHLPNVIDPTAMDIKAAGPPTKPHLPLAVAGSGRIGAQKDPDYFIACIQALRAGGHQVDGTWIGGGDEPAEQRLRKAGITVTGWMDRFSALTVLAEHHLYLHTARWEGFPMAVLEADALGVATAVRTRPHFSGLGLPLSIGEPEDLVSEWERFSTLTARQVLVDSTRQALAGHTTAAQASALSSLYATAGRPNAKKTLIPRQESHA